MAPKHAQPGYHCTECGWTAAKWVGRCGECQQWGTVVERGAAPAGPVTRATAVTSAAVSLAEVPSSTSERFSTGVGEFDRVLGGGMVSGAVVLLAGEPGVGKSTLLLDVAARAGQDGKRVLYISGEESVSQVGLRARRIGADHAAVMVAAETDLGAVLAHLDQHRPDLVLIDSLQTVASAAVDGAPGGVSQMREVASALIKAAKSADMSMVLVGHVTRDGSVAGPRTVEHLVDVVCHFEGDPHSSLRMLRALKNRYGSVDEVGCFQLVDAGIESVTDPSGLFLSHESAAVAGSCATITMDGKRPLPVELQALVASSALANPRRATSGIDASRMAMIVAVLHRRVGIALAADDVYVSTVGGAKVTEPGADLALALALASARMDVAVPAGWAGVGEIALSGAIRPVRAMTARVNEAARLGFTDVVVPVAGEPPRHADLRVHPVDSVKDAITRVLPRG